MSGLPAGTENDPNAPWNNEKESECLYCGNPCEGMYCSNEHKKADLD